MSVDRIHHLSSFNNKKPIKINVKLSTPTPTDLLESKDLKKKAYYFEEILDDKSKKKLNFFRNEFIYKSHKIYNTFTDLDISLEIKYFGDKKNSQAGSKINKIQIRNKDGVLATYKRINRQYNYIINENELGYIEENRKTKEQQRKSQ